jgi:hypothetical protein
VNRLLGLAVTLVCAGSLGAFPLPPPLEIGYLVGKGLPAGVPPVALTDEFYALGWSRSNAFAYLVRRTLVAGSREVDLEVVDVVADEPLARVVWPDWGSDDAQDDWWQAHEAEADDVFRRWHIEAIDNQLGQFPLILDNEYFTLVQRPGADRRAPGWIDSLTVLVNSTGKGLKTVGEATGYWRWAALLGFIPSPFENRVVVVGLVQPVGWLGPRQPLRYVVSGLSLKAGFPKP